MQRWQCPIYNSTLETFIKINDEEEIGVFSVTLTVPLNRFLWK